MRYVGSTYVRAHYGRSMNEVRDRVAFVSGGSSGIGLGIAQAFVEAGMKVVIGYRTAEHLANAKSCLAEAGDRIHAIRVDVTNRSEVEAAALETRERFGKVHVLVGNAGVGVLSPLSSTTYGDWDWTIGVNLNGVFNCVHAFLPYIRENDDGGHVVAVSSMGGLYAAGTVGAYTTTKFAVVGMMETLRAELAQTNVGVSVCCPGLVSSNIVTSERNRPGALNKPGPLADHSGWDALREQMNNPELSMSPQEVGSLVLSGVRRNDLYILTHPEYEELIRARHAAIVASFPRDLQVTKARTEILRAVFESSIYR